MVFIDVHCHLEMCRNPEKAVENARKAEVIAITQGVKPESNKCALEFAEKYDNVKAALGGYPTDMTKLSEKEIDREIELIRRNKDKIVAIGEVGLDFKEDSVNKEKQIEIFRKFIDLAKEIDMPIIVHSRKAEEEAIEMLEKSDAKKVIMHCFSGRFSLVKRIADNKWHLSIPASINYSDGFKKIAKEIELDRLFCETDSPYLHPEKGKRDNEPANVVFVYKKIAEIKEINLKEVEKKIEENYRKLFGA